MCMCVFVYIGTEAKEWIPELTKFIHPSQLPVKYGGTCACAGRGPNNNPNNPSSPSSPSLACFQEISKSQVKSTIARLKKNHKLINTNFKQRKSDMKKQYEQRHAYVSE